MALTLTQKSNDLGQLGLPPMELAETNENDRNNNNKCLKPILLKTIIMFLIVLTALGIYILFLCSLQSNENVRNTEIILVTGSHQPENITVVQDDVDIFVRLNNRTVNHISSAKRTKRHSNLKMGNANKSDVNKIKDNDDNFQKIKKIIMEHDLLCNEDSHNLICNNFITKLKTLTSDLSNNATKRKENTPLKIYKEANSIRNKEYKFGHDNYIAPSELTKREIFSDTNQRMTNFEEPRQYRFNFGSKKLKPSHSHPYYSDMAPLQDHAGCPYGSYDVPSMEHGHPLLPYEYSGDFIPYTHAGYLHNRNEESESVHKRKLHSQDIEIIRSSLRKKTDVPSNKRSNTTVREVDCPSGSVSCNNGDACIKENQWCDGNVDCDDVSDEARCGCRSRVDTARICDSYFDCPFGEDEMGCYGCGDEMFSCGDLDTNSRGTCFSKEQRCNNVVDCPNQKDELECSILAPSLHKEPMFAVSNTEGYLHRNFKGTWYAVCENPYIWAHDACHREVGLVIGPPHIQYVKIDPLVKVNYLNTSPGGLIRMTTNCINNSAAYVVCSDIPCGTRVLTKHQLIHENVAVENRLFGRNKRFFLQNPYPYKAYFRNRDKRNDHDFSEVNDKRSKRTEGRVVGGQPSQPAAWPWMVALYRDGSFHCGGVIISQNWILSAAHCVQNFWEHYYEIQVGMLRRFSFSPQEQNHRVTHVIVNKNYNRENMKSDLSLLKVKPYIQFSRWVRPICLPGPTAAGHDWMWGPAPHTVCTAVGWGATKERGPDPDHMREVDVPIWERCIHREDLAGNEICAGFVEGGRDTCQGDSGGPLLCRNPMNSQQWYIAGIVSHGDGCARKNEPGVYTRVSMFVKWIKYHTTSPSLPMIQPKRECPGFRCESGITKCLPKKRMCDKIVDCLDGEDEINCDYLSSRTLTDTFFSTSTNLDPQINSLFKDVNDSITSEITAINNNINMSISPSAHTQSEKGHKTSRQNRDNIMTAEEELKNSKLLKPNISYTTDFKLEDDLKHASTIEMPYGSDSDEGVTDSIETSTINTIEMSTSQELDTQTMMLKNSNKVLEPMSSKLEETTRELNNEHTNLEDFTTTEFILYSTSTHNTTDIISINDNSTINNDNSLAEIIDQNSNDWKSKKVQFFEKKVSENATTNPQNEVDSTTKSQQLIIELLPSGETDNSLIDKINILENTTEQPTTVNNLEVNSLQTSNASHELIDTIKEIAMSDLQPVNIRRKHKTPDEFHCQRISQTVPYVDRCNKRADCEDGTDEFGCSCIDYLTTFDETLICDGNLDCSEGEDENNCFKCEEGHFLCKRSQMCLPPKYVCDGKLQCPQGEDEMDCYALTNGIEIEYDFDGKPKVNLEGYITRKHDNDWHIVCEDNLTILQQEQAATHICRYLGFSSANKYLVKYVNIKEDKVLEASTDRMKRKRSSEKRTPVKFTYRNVNNNETAKSIVINEPEILKEQCVPNITKICMSLYVFCDYTLFSAFDLGQDNVLGRQTAPDSVHMWPWIAKIFVDGDYKCTGILLEVSWVLVSHSCLRDSLFSQHYISVVLGSHKTLDSSNGPYEQIIQVDFKKDLYRNQVILLHLMRNVTYSTMVKPMITTSYNYHEDENTTCVAIGENNNNQSIAVFVRETNDKCDSQHRCFVRRSDSTICNKGTVSLRRWSGIISCHSKNGWYPAASFTDERGECGIDDRIISTDIGNIKFELKQNRVPISTKTDNDLFNNCGGARCSRGKCIQIRQLCDGVRDCEDGFDESEQACFKKEQVCGADPYDSGCDCAVGKLKCRNGRCIFKELFRNGRDDCGDGTDEPRHTSCSDYLSRVMPSRLCDGILNCHDRSDEDPSFCKCFAKRVHKCTKSSSVEDYCVATDMVCDGVPDCPNGEDEQTCVGLSAPQGTPHGIGKVIIREHGVWYTKCYRTQNHTKLELEAICRELGFKSGHAKQLPVPLKSIGHPHNGISVDTFSEVLLNNNTILKLRNTQNPIAKPIIVENLDNCYPVYIECL